MSRWAWVLCAAMASAALADERAVLVPEGEEPASVLEGAQWTWMGSVGAVVFHPEGHLLASGGSDGAVRLWDVATGRELRRMVGHTEAVLSLAFSPDGSTLASGGGDNTVRLWRVDTGLPLRPLAGHSSAVRSLAFSPDGRILASAGDDKTVRVWKTDSHDSLAVLEGHADPVLSFDSEGRELALGGSEARLRRWRVGTWRELQAPAQEPSQGKVVQALATHEAPAVYMQQAGTGRALSPVEGTAEPVVVLSPDRRLVASAGGDHTVRVRRAGSGRELLSLKGHTGKVQSLAFSPDGRLLASGGSDQTVRLWEVGTGQELWRLEGNGPPVWSIAFGPEGRTLLSGGSDTLLHLWDASTGRELLRLEHQEGPVRAVAASPDGRLLASGGEDGFVYLWEPSTGHAPRRLQGHAGPVRTVAFSPDGHTLASGGDDRMVRLWEVRSGNALAPLEKHMDAVNAVAFSPDGLQLASGGQDGLLLLWELGAGSEPQRLRGPTGPVRAVAFSPDGELLASGGDDRRVRLWRTASGEPTGSARDHSRPVWSVAFSPDGQTLASGGDRLVRLWKVRGASPPRLLRGHERWITSLAFSADGQTLASSDDGGAVLLWSLPADPPLRGTLRASQQGWLSQLSGQPLLRHDAGRFLSQATQDGSLAPAPPPRPEAPPQLSLEGHELLRPPGDFGDAGELVLTVSNALGAGRAYWLRVEPVELPPGLLLLPPPPVPRLEAGSSARMRVGLSYWRPAGALMPEAPQVRLRLVDAFGTEFPLEGVPVAIRTSELRLSGEPHVEGKALSFTLRNEGTRATGKFTVVSSLQSESARELVRVEHPQPNLEPGEEGLFSIPLNHKLLEAEQLSLRLNASYEPWPRTWTGPTTAVQVPWAWGLFGAVAVGLGALLLFAVVHYARVYRNPVVVQAARAPSAIKGFPLAHLLSADHALRRARRLDATITAAGIPLTRWQRALDGAKAPREAAAAFAAAVGGRLGASVASQSWALELPPLRLRFTPDTALVVVDGGRLESGEAERLMTDVFQEGRGPSQVLVLDRTLNQNAVRVLQGVPRVRCVVLGTERLRDLLLAEEPVRMLEATISEQVAVSELSPYQVSGGVKLEHFFFGRERELRAISDRAMHNFLVVGQRQMGKSSLLLAVLRRLQARSDVEVRYVELADADLHRRLARERGLLPAGGAPVPSFEEVAAGEPRQPRVWLIDEADGFIVADARAGYPLVQAMRALAEEGRAYFVLAGFWELYRAVVLDEKQPLRNFGEQLRLEPLDARAALALLTEPMAALGLKWATPEGPEYLLEQAGRRANLLVLACKGLVETLPPDTHELTREHLEQVLREDKDLRDQGRRWRGDHPLHRAVVRQALLLGRPTRQEVGEALRARGADIRAMDFDEAMDHRELSYVLVPDGEGRLYCPVPLMQRYIESERGLEAGLVEDLEDLRRRGLSGVPPPI